MADPTSKAPDIAGYEPGGVLADRYELQRELGHGGSATVHLARDRRHDRLVAVKVLRPELASHIGAERFLREIVVTARMRHPHIIGVLDSGEEHGLLYYVTPYLEGQSLRVRLEEERQLAVEEVLRIAYEVCDALQCAHDHELVHRDVKPENILFSGGHAYVADFGIAHAITRAAGPRLTSSGMVLGTPAYMSPEQGAGEGKLDGRSDQYSFACVLYEMIGGMPPFVGPTPESVIAQRYSYPPRPLRAYRPSVPAHIEEAISRAMSVTPADRFASMREFATALGAAPPGATPNGGTTVVEQALAGRSTSGAGTRGAGEPSLRTGTSEADANRTRRVRRVVLSLVAAIALVALAFVVRPDAFPIVTSPVAARDRGAAALRRGDVEEASRWLARAATRDPDDPATQLWIATRRALFPGDTADWRRPLALAMSQAAMLGRADSLRAVALSALAERRHPEACAGFRRVQAVDARDVSAMLGLASCIQGDRAVVADPSSPSGWAFRTSHHDALREYERALDEVPDGSALRSTIYRRLLALFEREWGRYRRGHADGDPGVSFAGVLALGGEPAGSSLVHVPYTPDDVRSSRPERELTTASAALDSSRSIASRLAARWTRERPSEPDAHVAYAQALELQGDIRPARPDGPSALGEIRRARSLVSGTPGELVLLHHEVRLLAKQGEFGAAAALGDSAVARFTQPDVDGRWVLASIAVLTGRARRAATFLAGVVDDTEYALPDGRRYTPPRQLGETVVRLSAYAAVGAPVDSIVALRERAERELSSYVSERERGEVRTAVLGRMMSQAVPALGARALAGIAPDATPLVRLQGSLARGDRAGVLRSLDSLRSVRAGHPPGALQVDQAYQEAWLRTAAGDTSGAVAQLDAVLEALPAIGSLLLEDIPRAAALPRAMKLRAELARALGDEVGARRWREAASALLGFADAEATP